MNNVDVRYVDYYDQDLNDYMEELHNKAEVIMDRTKIIDSITGQLYYEYKIKEEDRIKIGNYIRRRNEQTA